MALVISERRGVRPPDAVDMNCEAIVALDMAIEDLRLTRRLLVEENRRKSGKRTSA